MFYCLLPCPPSTAPSNGCVTYSSIADDNDTSYAFEVVLATYSCFIGFSLVGTTQGLALYRDVSSIILVLLMVLSPICEGKNLQ